MKRWIRNHVSNLTAELKLINKQLKKLKLKQELLKRKIKMFNKVLNHTDDHE
jgi:hypothetical protein